MVGLRCWETCWRKFSPTRFIDAASIAVVGTEKDLRTVTTTPGEYAPPTVDATIAQLVTRARTLAASGRRRILGITGPPGAGKSTVCAQLQAALGSDAVLVGMDGFHLANAELVRLGRLERKGAPDTFDVDGYVALLGRLRAQPARIIYAPAFDRSIEESIGSAIAVDARVPLVITEGNYLLCDSADWRAVAAQLDESWFLDVNGDERRRRLIARRESYGHPSDAAVAWVDGVDEPNGVLVEPARARADLIIRVSTTSNPSFATGPSADREGVRP